MSCRIPYTCLVGSLSAHISLLRWAGVGRLSLGTRLAFALCLVRPRLAWLLLLASLFQASHAYNYILLHLASPVTLYLLYWFPRIMATVHSYGFQETLLNLDMARTVLGLSISRIRSYVCWIHICL